MSHQNEITGTLDWSQELQELAQRAAYATQMGGAAAVERHHAAGRLTVRERIGNLTDADSFQEVGKLTGQGHYEHGVLTGVTPAPYVMGLAAIDGRSVAVGGEDFTIRGGSSWSGDRKKGGQGGFVEELALQYRIPLVNLIDGAGGSVTSQKKRGHTVFPGVYGFETSVALMGTVPVVSAVLGTAAGGPAGRAILSHWSVMVQNTSHIFAAGPPVVERSLGQKITKEELGGPKTAVDQAGLVDNVATDEAQCFEMIRRYLSYMPSNVWELPPVLAGTDPIGRREEELASIVPRDRRKPYNMRKLIGLIVDTGSVFEIQPSFGKAVITSLARLNGKVVGIIANNPMVYGGAMDMKAARKQTHFIELCDTFHIPLIFLVDVPGFMVGKDAEMAGTLREGMRSVYVSLQATVPMVTVVIRKCYGMAGMATTDKNGIGLKLAWPSAEWGSLPIEGGVAAAFRREIAEAADPKMRERELEHELRALSSPMRTAEAFGVEDVIDPRDTRGYLCRFIDAAQLRLKTSLGPKLRGGVRP
ncbi:Methylmalonyl-CoA carboxyltransferase 12S subunit (plasmid) [Variovorax sp. SRS16]|uniref:acyl-CoA carboxylase subunit beta n=1 Tax=Variovorax sp. SRS16 TaxID=282217 RepID=UPI00131742BC|nr:carboxyl transferase domain-containing protein [Variovorax sp. SRS16]VTU46599.1 Methylmalonyl-CoA carboxyltransferase 12S subunit [Variovorax sp. SRS16]